MPLYEWVDEKTGYEVTIENHYDNYRKPPEDEDLPEEERGKDREWRKKISSGIKVNRPAYYGTKGNW